MRVAGCDRLPVLPNFTFHVFDIEVCSVSIVAILELFSILRVSVAAIENFQQILLSLFLKSVKLKSRVEQQFVRTLRTFQFTQISFYNSLGIKKSNLISYENKSISTVDRLLLRLFSKINTRRKEKKRKERASRAPRSFNGRVSILQSRDFTTARVLVAHAR